MKQLQAKLKRLQTRNKLSLRPSQHLKIRKDIAEVKELIKKAKL